MMLLAMIATSCRTDAAPASQDTNLGPRVEVVDVDELPPELRQVAMEASDRQAAAGEGAKAVLHRAWNYAPPPVLDTADAKLVAIDLQLDIPGTGFDLDDIDIIDADTKENYGSGPILQRLTASGTPVEFNDPDVAADNHHFRLLCVWAVPRRVRRVELGYWNASLSDAIEIVDRSDGPRAVEYATSVVAYRLGAREGDEQIHYLWFDCNCSRVDRAPWYQLVAGSELVNPTKEVAVDEHGAPRTLPVQQLPYYARFGWVAEYRVPAATKIEEINQTGKRSPLPQRSFEMSKALVDALAHAPTQPTP